VTVARARQRDSDAIAYVATYVVPFATLGVSDWRSRAALLLFLALIAVLYIRAHLFYVNPLLSIVGYRLFEVETGSDQLLLVVTRRSFLAAGAELDVRTLSDYVYLEG
jgi:fatty-acid desaturase